METTSVGASTRDLLQPLSFAPGIEQLLRSPDDRKAPVDFSPFRPTDLKLRPNYLGRLLDRQSVEDAIFSALKPEVFDRQCLASTHFYAALAMMRSATAAQPDETRSPLERQVNEILRDELDLRDMLNMFRGALLQG